MERTRRRSGPGTCAGIGIGIRKDQIRQLPAIHICTLLIQVRNSVKVPFDLDSTAFRPTGNPVVALLRRPLRIRIPRKRGRRIEI